MSALLCAVVLTVTAAIAAVNYRVDVRAGEEAATRHMQQVAEAGARALAHLQQRGAQLTLSLASLSAAQTLDTSGDRTALLRPVSRMLHTSDNIFSLFIGRPDGSYMELSNLEAARGLREAWGAAATDRWLLLEVSETPGGWSETRSFLDTNLVARTVSREPTNYRATERPWYALAQPDRVQRTAPYDLDIYKARAVSHVTRSQGGPVVGAIVLLSSLSEMLTIPGAIETTFSALFQADGQLIASSDAGAADTSDAPPGDADARLAALRANAGAGIAPGVPGESVVNGREYLVFTEAIDDYGGGPPATFIGTMVDRRAVRAPSVERATQTAWLSLAIAAAILPVALLASRSITHPMRELSMNTQRIRHRQYDQVREVGSYVAEVHWLSDSLNDMAGSIRHYEAQQRRLLDAIVKLIAGAIDQKSPYTGAHCERVPALARALARAASDSQQPALRDFAIGGADAWREFEMAAWLHDCGKITTPEFVMDKGSKLETLYNRIHEVRMRFEVLLRDAEIEYWRALSESPEEKARLDERLRERQRGIRDDFRFVARCNVGDEALDDAGIDRLQAIGEQTWVRHLDDRIGLSPAEEVQLRPYPSQTPAVERLLADKKEHIVIDARAHDRYRGRGFTMKAPAHKLNLGELHNLGVRRGTLTEEERYLINEHITATISMLEALPWPEQLSNVPAIAGGHHEKLDGTGYPRSLTAEELPMAARILAIADVFEALTAADRPYKSPKRLSAAMSILRKMVDEQHLDGALFRVFVESGAYRDYAERFLAPEQNDGVDELALLRGLD